ncbi:MAG: endonuclease/exonuclease/phosphatase family protein [Calothrix sp. MO_192.B10]|nr:endonuclease/exonuclease/phosphatase family protein [Calothrix sp. MO_192.B10]
MIQRVILTLATITLLFVGIVSFTSYEAWSWPLELIAHFRNQYLIVSLIITIVLVLLWRKHHLQHRLILIIALVVLGLNAIDIMPWYLPNPQRVDVNTPEKMRVLSFNINTQNTHLQEIVNLVQDTKPDVALFIEVNRGMVQKLKTELKESLPYNFRSPGGGLAIFSRSPIKNAKGENFYGQGNHNLIATLEIDRKPVKFIGTHPLTPITRRTFNYRNLQLNALSNYISRLNQPVILAGDFNLTPWSPYYRQLIRRIKLHNTRLGFGILPSWPRTTTYINLKEWMIPLLNIPIDHCFVSKHFKVANIYTGDNANSDHAPLIVDLVLHS